MKPIQCLKFLISAASLLICTAGMAQYQWIDANGRKVFSDQPPPASVPAKKIVQQPGKTTPVAASTDADSAASAKTDAVPAAPVAAKPKTLDKELEAKKKQADDELAVKKNADQELQDKNKRENCERAKNAKAGLNSGTRIVQYNSKGERVVMDDAARMVETKRIEGIIQSDCK